MAGATRTRLSPSSGIQAACILRHRGTALVTRSPWRGLPRAGAAGRGEGGAQAAARGVQAAGAWDICFLAIDPKRAEGIDFTAPYVVIEGAYLVPDASPLRSVDEVDRSGVRVMVDHGSAYDLFLQRSLRHATLVYPPDGQRAGPFYLEAPVEVLAGVRQPLADMAAAHPGFRLIPGRFMQIDQAVGVIHGRQAGLEYVRGFVEDMKASGFVARSLAASGQADAEVAPAAR